ncbi:hypothetical protein pdul_cds_961 [Pandoravirus dulcis]|uniref:Ankyrin repeat domain containing protein n=1 Tax=Pandoravirus dulcis TaxID=1349409 RepID=S4VS41_9VIRU|nr:hypothetical protein pdul_cds_961 [Pandoravirus dulcis]AGO83213.1 hypothetical protein pdul_cds_961 [Pandoravirus dulcis]
MNNLPMDVAASVQAVDDDLSLGSLPAEVLEMVLRSAGPFATARAAGTSQYMRQVARGAAEQEKGITARELCSDYEACLREFLLATAEDDADTVEYIIASGAIDPRRPVIASVVALPRPPLNPYREGVIMFRDSPPQEVDPYALLRTAPPTAEGWTPLAVAAAYGAPAVIARLASIGVRPRPTVETLIDGLLHRGWQLYSAAPVIRGVKALTETYPRTSPLAPEDENPLTALREYAVRRGSARKGILISLAFPPDRGVADAVALFDADALPIAGVLLRAGYSPDERAQPAVGNRGRAASEMDLLREKLRETESQRAAMFERQQEALRYLYPRDISGPPRRAPTRAVLQRLLDFYEQRRGGASTAAGPLRVVPSVDAMEWEGQI